MQYLWHFVTLVLSGYLALTNTVAFGLGTSFTMPTNTVSGTAIDRVANADSPIPKILLEQPRFQEATAIGAIQPPESTTSPLQAIVNVYCTYRTKTYIRTTTGSGVFIDPKGIILTNAHVAQFLLLAELGGTTNCEVRTGNPATPTYTADLLYISPTWIQNNADLITQSEPKGTGERDYALLYVTSGLNHQPMPERFPYLAYDARALTMHNVGDSVTVAGYPAEKLLTQDGAKAPLVPEAASTTINDIMTFATTTADVIAVGNTDVGQAGSSGGPIVNRDNRLIGLISTKGDPQYGTSSLRAISLSYIDRSIKQETGFPLAQNLSGNLPYRSTLFKQTLAPFLETMLQQQLKKHPLTTQPQ